MGIRCKMAVEEGPVDWEDSQAKKSLSDFVDEPRHAGVFGYTTSLCDLSTEVFVLGVYLPGEAFPRWTPRETARRVPGRTKVSQIILFPIPLLSTPGYAIRYELLCLVLVNFNYTTIE